MPLDEYSEEVKMRESMRFYVNMYLNSNREELQKVVDQMAPYMDEEYLKIHLNQYLEKIEEELADKFDKVCRLIMSAVMSGKESEVREFEVLFMDLLRRTLLKDVKEKEVNVIVVAPTEGSNHVH